MRLHIGMLGAEEFLGAIARQVLDHVDKLAAAIVAAAGIAFGVLVGEDAAGGFENSFGSEIFARNELDLRVLALGLMADGVVNFRVNFGQWTRHAVGHRGNEYSSIG